ncbi:hypothetical protein SEA_AYOTOYA_37 [Gordonia phage Ayotoya]|nr:hypothetical protein SEA_AYOTOYA_37 [Gordonia phage Ayotoya]URP21264.1 hypothetical protein SEA_CHOP_37 [Gordonia phage Chop]UXL91312.1 hypothetical protein SEA_GRANDSLAM_37 [Gordonia phage GrandSlam]
MTSADSIEQPIIYMPIRVNGDTGWDNHISIERTRTPHVYRVCVTDARYTGSCWVWRITCESSQVFDILRTAIDEYETVRSETGDYEPALGAVDAQGALF